MEGGYSGGAEVGISEEVGQGELDHGGDDEAEAGPDVDVEQSRFPTHCHVSRVRLTSADSEHGKNCHHPD